MKGQFITFEGIDGSGKSTQIYLLAEYLQTLGQRIVLTREPGGTHISDQVRKILLNPDNTNLDAMAELFLYAASRTQHVRDVISPSLDAGHTVLCDRFSDATLAYQGYGRGLDLEMIRTIDRFVTGQMRPNITILLDIDPSAGLGRAHGRNSSRGLETEARFENEKLAFHERVRRGYLQLAGQEPDRIRIIDASLPPESVQLAIRACIQKIYA